MTEEPLLIRRLGTEDLTAAAALEQGLPGAWSEAMLEAELHRPRGWQFIGLIQGNSLPICFACGHTVGQEAELYRMAVAAAHRRRGLGTLFLRTLLGTLAADGVSTCWLEVRAANYPAIGLYRKLGFFKESIRKKYYADPPEDAIIMQWVAKAPGNSASN